MSLKPSRKKRPIKRRNSKHARCVPKKAYRALQVRMWRLLNEETDA